jgi:hypothetical protein
MKRKYVLIPILLIILPVGVYSLIFPMGTSFHFEKSGNVEKLIFLVDVRNVKDCNVSFSFADDTDLLYSLDIEMYSFVSSSSFYVYDTDSSVHVNTYARPGRSEWTGGDLRVKKIDFKLGIGCAYSILVVGTNLTTSFTYSNGALIGQDSAIHCYAVNSSVSFKYDGYDVDTTTYEKEQNPVRLSVKLGDVDETQYLLNQAILNIDLPNLYNGRINVDADSISQSMSGWYIVDEHSYYTDEVDGYPPELFMDISSTDVSLNLMKSI